MKRVGRPAKDKRNARIYKLHVEKGMSYNTLAKMFDVTPSRVGAIIQNERAAQANKAVKSTTAEPCAVV